MVTAPIYFAQVDTMMTDLISAAAIVTAVALLVLARRTTDRAAALVGLAGIALGLGIGSKYTALLPGLVVGLAAIFLLRRSRTWWWLVPGVLVLAAPWYLRNIITTGNPLFPKAIGPIDGASSPIEVLEASLIDQLRAGDTVILRRAVTLARGIVGPLLVLVAAGVVAPFVVRARDGDVGARRWVGLLAIAGLGLYLATPYTGGGPTGLDFIIASCFRYAMIGMLLASVAGVVLAGRWIGAIAVGGVFMWNLWKIVDGADLERQQLEVTGRTFAAALLVTVVVMLLTHLAATNRDLVRRAPVGAVALVVAMAALFGSFGLYHRLDRGRTPTPLEATLLALGEDRPAIVIGVADLRAVLGPRLERRMIGVSRGGAAEEIPFVDEAQFRRHILGEDTAPPPPHLAAELDRALDEADADVLVTGSSPLGYPDGWRPAEGWCPRGRRRGRHRVRASGPAPTGCGVRACAGAADAGPGTLGPPMATTRNLLRHAKARGGNMRNRARISLGDVRSARRTAMRLPARSRRAAAGSVRQVRSRLLDRAASARAGSGGHRDRRGGGDPRGTAACWWTRPRMPVSIIGDRVRLAKGTEIVCSMRVTIGEAVSSSDYVTITDSWALLGGPSGAPSAARGRRRCDRGRGLPGLGFDRGTRGTSWGRRVRRRGRGGARAMLPRTLSSTATRPRAVRHHDAVTGSWIGERFRMSRLSRASVRSDPGSPTSVARASSPQRRPATPHPRRRRAYGSYGHNTWVVPPARVTTPSSIFLGDDVHDPRALLPLRGRGRSTA